MKGAAVKLSPAYVISFAYSTFFIQQSPSPLPNVSSQCYSFFACQGGMQNRQACFDTSQQLYLYLGYDLRFCIDLEVRLSPT